MFRDRPLTWLFIAATICVDLVIWSSEGMAARTAFWVLLLLCPAQLSVLAIWLVLGDGHRLTRAALLTVAACLLMRIAWSFNLGLGKVWMQASLVHVVILLVAVSIARVLCVVPKVDSAGVNTKSLKFQFSLIELFGWTIIVAIWSFLARSINFEGLLSTVWTLLLTLPIAAFVTVLILFQNKIIVRKEIKLLILLGIVVVQRLVFGQTELGSAIWMNSFSQMAFITTWWCMLWADEAMRNRRKERDFGSPVVTQGTSINSDSASASDS